MKTETATIPPVAIIETEVGKAKDVGDIEAIFARLGFLAPEHLSEAILRKLDYVDLLLGEYRKEAKDAYMVGDLSVASYYAVLDFIRAKKVSEVKTIIAKLRELRGGNNPSVSMARTSRAKGSADMDKLIQLLGAQMYQGNLAEVTVKETVQNSFDAVKAMTKKRGSPTGRIEIILDSVNRVIVIKDNGTGMNLGTLRNAFLKVAGSEKKGLAKEDRSGGFGMAKAAFLYGNEWIIVSTVKEGKRLTFRANSRDLFKKGAKVLKSEAGRKDHGTTVVIKVPEKYKTSDGQEHHIWFPSGVGDIEFFRRPLVDPKLEITLSRKHLDEFDSNDVNEIPEEYLDPENDTVFNPNSEKWSERGKETLDLGKHFSFSGYKKQTTIKFDWGKADVYVGLKEKQSWRVKHEILSSGVFQFEYEKFEIERWKKIPFDIVVNIFPSVEAEHYYYPFDIRREGFKSSVKDDIKTLAEYLRAIAIGVQNAQTAEAFKNFKTLELVGIEEAGTAKVDDTLKERLERARLDVEREKLERAQKSGGDDVARQHRDIKIKDGKITQKVDPKDVDVEKIDIEIDDDVTPEMLEEMNRAIGKLEGKSGGGPTGGGTGPKEKIRITKDGIERLLHDVKQAEGKSDAPEKSGPTFEYNENAGELDPNKVLEEANIDPSKPIFFNVTNLDPHKIAKEAGFDADVMFSEIGSLVMAAKQKLASHNLNDLDSLKSKETPLFVGIAINKRYLGLNTASPVKGIWLNPIGLAKDRNSNRTASLPGMAWQFYDTIMHEFAHERARDHSESFTQALHDIHSAMASDGTDIELRVAISRVLKKYYTLLDLLREEYGKSTTQNVEKAFHEGEGSDGVASRGGAGQPDGQSDELFEDVLGTGNGEGKSFIGEEIPDGDRCLFGCGDGGGVREETPGFDGGSRIEESANAAYDNVVSAGTFAEIDGLFMWLFNETLDPERTHEKRIKEKYARIIDLPEVDGDLTPDESDLFTDVDSLDVSPTEFLRGILKISGDAIGGYDYDRARSVIADRLGELMETYRYEGFEEGRELELYIDKLLAATDRAAGLQSKKPRRLYKKKGFDAQRDRIFKKYAGILGLEETPDPSLLTQAEQDLFTAIDEEEIEPEELEKKLGEISEKFYKADPGRLYALTRSVIADQVGNLIDTHRESSPEGEELEAWIDGLLGAVNRAEGKTPSAAKEPWEMTREEYARSGLEKEEAVDSRGLTDKRMKSLNDSDPAWQYSKAGGNVVRFKSHRKVVQKALSEGKPVPPEVLADYHYLELANEEMEPQGYNGYPVGSKKWFKGDEVTITTEPYENYGGWWQDAVTERGKTVTIKAKTVTIKAKQEQFAGLHKKKPTFYVGQKIKFRLATGSEGIGSYRGPDTDGGVVLTIDGQMWHVAQEDVIGPFEDKNSDEDQKFQQFRQTHEKYANGKYTALKDMRFELRKQGWSDKAFDAYAMDMAAKGVIVLLTEFDGRDPDLRRYGVVDPVFPDDVYTFLKWRGKKDPVMEAVGGTISDSIFENNGGWIGVDLDGTLAVYDGWKGPEHIGEPVERVLSLVKLLVNKGKDVRILTARANEKENIPHVKKWLNDNGLDLPVTDKKDLSMIAVVDDRAIPVKANEGRYMSKDEIVDFAYSIFESVNLKAKKFKLQDRYQFQGFPISIENKKGSVRKGTDPTGNEWSIKMKYDYGYIRSTEGADNEGVDVYVGSDRKAPHVYVVKQHKIDKVAKWPNKPYCPECLEHAHDCACKRFYDEDKVFVGFPNKEAAKEAYLAQYDSELFLGPISTMTVEDFKKALESSGGKKIPLQFVMEGIADTPFKKFKAVQEKIEERNLFIRDWLKSHRRKPFRAKTVDGRDVVLTKSAKPGYVWQMTFFDRNGEPISDINYLTYEAALKDHTNGIDTLSIEPIKRRKTSQILEDAAPVLSRTSVFDEILTANTFDQIENAVKNMLSVSISPEPVTAESIIEMLKQASREEVEKISSYLADINNQIAKEVNYRSRTGKSVRVVEGKMDVAYLPDNSELGFQYAVVEIDDLVTSHTDSFYINEDFPQEAQPRDRERAAARLQVEEMAKKLNPSRLGESQSVTAGAPIVGPDMVVESGNGRSIAIRKAYRNFPEKADEYRAWIHKNAEKLGLSGAKISGMKEPVLIRVRKSELDRADFARKANQAEIAQMSPTEIARADAERITDDDLAVFAPSEDGRVLARSNTVFIDRFLSKLGTNETAGLLTKDGRYTKQLEDRIKAAVFEKAYGDPVLLEFMAEETDPKIKNIITALTISAPGWVSAKAVDPELGGINIPSHAIGAAKIIRKSRDSGEPVEMILNQMGLWEQIPEETKRLTRFFQDNIRSSKRMGKTFAIAAGLLHDLLADQNQMDMFGKPPAPTPSELIEKAINAVEEAEHDKQGQLF